MYRLATNNMNTKIFAAIVVLVSLLGLYYVLRPLQAKVRIKDAVFAVDVAVTEAQKQKGLGGRDSLPDGHGMLFPYDHIEQYEFWMKDMRFPIDIVWIRGKTVVDISQNVPPPKANERPVIVKPSEAVDKVLEIKAGSSKEFGISIGDYVEFIDK